MKMAFAVIFLLTLCYSTFCQDKNIPSWYLDDISSEVGLWIADNSKYKSESEPYDEYAVEWEWSPMKNSIYGRLFGRIGGKDVESFWDFHKYWDPAQKQVIVMQIGGDGTVGIGPLRRTGAMETELIQIFTKPDGTQWKDGHRTTRTSSAEKTGNSFDIGENNEWIPRRTYSWKMQVSRGMFDSALAARLKADDYGMGRYIFVFLKTGPNRSPDDAAAAKLQTDHLRNMVRLANEGKLVLAGPFIQGGDYRGLFVLNVETVEEANNLVSSDPMIAAGVLVAEFLPWYGSAALKLVSEWHEKVALKSIVP